MNYFQVSLKILIKIEAKRLKSGGDYAASCCELSCHITASNFFIPKPFPKKEFLSNSGKKIKGSWYFYKILLSE